MVPNGQHPYFFLVLCTISLCFIGSSSLLFHVLASSELKLGPETKPKEMNRFARSYDGNNCDGLFMLRMVEIHAGVVGNSEKLFWKA
ncbi:unnamed protein product [Onchocerca flexuosa]|uniref:Cytochrom_C_asm domain-containing protein n=1 Tax=Onchocerca flexuosa TaxID=387005 RepID=A0A183I0Z7_9BILA|nr:unnamed protein product [Onchocerca flexuosa]